MTRSSNAGLLIAGGLLILLGIAGIAMPSFDTQQTKDVAKLGDLHVTAKEDTPHFIPPMVAEGAVAVGVVLLAAGFFRRA